MANLKRMKVIISIIIALPILLSLDTAVYDSTYYAKYKSPEGILFLSYTEEWNENKLEELYNELLKNKHGDELSLLQEVRIRGGAMYSNPAVRGRYHSLTSTITLFKGDLYTTPSSLRETLSHEYGHHFAYYYVKSHHLPFSKWSILRGLQNTPTRWDAFWNYSGQHHKWFPQEIMADDYVLLYGAAERTNIEDAFSNEAFYTRTQHENQSIPNVLGNKELHQYLEKLSGIPIDQNRFLETPVLSGFEDDSLLFSVTKKENVAYRLNLSFYEKEKDSYFQSSYYELLQLSSDDNKSIAFSLENPIWEAASSSFNGYIKANLDVLDLNTSIGFQTDYFHIKVRDNHIVDVQMADKTKE